MGARDRQPSIMHLSDAATAGRNLKMTAICRAFQNESLASPYPIQTGLIVMGIVGESPNMISAILRHSFGSRGKPVSVRTLHCFLPTRPAYLPYAPHKPPWGKTLNRRRKKEISTCREAAPLPAAIAYAADCEL